MAEGLLALRRAAGLLGSLLLVALAKSAQAGAAQGRGGPEGFAAPPVAYTVPPPPYAYPSYGYVPPPGPYHGGPASPDAHGAVALSCRAGPVSCPIGPPARPGDACSCPTLRGPAWGRVGG
jgi:hypothetical protein